MAYRGSEAYDFSLFEPQIIEEPKKQQPRTAKPAGTAVKPQKKAPARKQFAKTTTTVKENAINFLDNYQVEVERSAQQASVPVSVKKALCFVAVCVSLVVTLLVMNTRCDTLMNEISAVENQIEIAKGENVRLNAELSSIISTDKIENYAENVLGMVKAENYQISYIDLSEGDEILLSGEKTVNGESELSGKIKELFAYIF